MRGRNQIDDSLDAFANFNKSDFQLFISSQLINCFDLDEKNLRLINLVQFGSKRKFYGESFA